MKTNGREEILKLPFVFLINKKDKKVGDLVNVFVYDNTQGTLIGRVE
ncbi:hypothetical protein BPO_1140 [Bergeyella porcorum]|uniref:TRAM domain-containing protein n=1 Tax=Bergeyella porcorum TaxID=1735111 RepID=A0AAU0EZF7_9FLAO